MKLWAIEKHALHVAMHETTQWSKIKRAPGAPGGRPALGLATPPFPANRAPRSRRPRSAAGARVPERLPVSGPEGGADARVTLPAANLTRPEPAQKGGEEGASPPPRGEGRGSRGCAVGEGLRAAPSSPESAGGQGADVAAPPLEAQGRSTRPRSPPGPGSLQPGDWGKQRERGERGPSGAASALTMAQGARLRVAGPAPEVRAERTREGLILAPTPPRGRSNGREAVGETGLLPDGAQRPLAAPPRGRPAWGGTSALTKSFG